MLPHDKYVPILKGAINRIELEQAVALAYAVMQGLKIPRFNVFMCANDDGTTQIEFNTQEFELKNSNYVLLSTPMRVDGKDGTETDAKKRLDITSSIFRAHMGKTFLRNIVFEGEVDAGEGRYQCPTDAIKLPQMSEWPFIHDLNWEQIREIFDQLKRIPKDTARRVEMALEFYGRALGGDEPFFNYWTALEILCNGKAQRIRHRIMRCYKLKSLSHVDRETGFRHISSWRHDFFHKGVRPDLDADVERYMQLLFLDLLRYEIDLPTVGHLAGIQSARGYITLKVGLSDNRTEEQESIGSESIENR